jgi:hypothetical protein
LRAGRDALKPDWISALTVVELDGVPLIITASHKGVLRSFWLDGTPGPLQSADANPRLDPRVGGRRVWWRGADHHW